MGAIGVQACDLTAALAVRNATGGFGSIDNAITLAGNLEKGFKLFLRWGDRSIGRLLLVEVTEIAGKSSVSVSQAIALIERTSRIVIALEDDKQHEILGRLQGMCLNLEDLKCVIPSIREVWDPKEVVNFSEFVRYAGLAVAFRKTPPPAPLHFDGALVGGMGEKVGARCNLLLSKGIKPSDLEGAIEFWRDGIISPKMTGDVVSVEALMNELSALMA